MKQMAYSAALMLLIALGASRQAAAQSTPFLGQISQFPFNFCPVGWLPADGRILPINQYTALFSLYGTTYGGDGVSTFALPKWGPTYAANGGPFTTCVATQGVFPSRT